MKLLVIASDKMELTGIVSHGVSSRDPALGVDWSRLVTLRGNDLLLIANGVGARRAMLAMDAVNDCFTPDAAVSTGFCGALDPRLQIAEIVVATCVAADDRRYGALPVSTGSSHARTVVRSADRVIQTAAEKRSLAALGFGAVEMEAGGVAARADARHLPFYCIRAVSDLADEDMANDFNQALTADGHFDTMNLLRSSLARPLVRIPELLRLRKRCVRAAQALGDFFDDCRF
jgi:adenosylhomocysteine nucleosidase